MNTPLTPRLEQGHAQTLVMTPQLQQAIKLLQLNNMELAAFLESEIAQNPLLEKAPPESDGDSLSDDSFDSPESGDSEDPRADAPDSGAALAFDAGVAPVGAGGNSTFDPMADSFENMPSAPRSLRDHLLQQLHMDCQDPQDRLIGALLIDLIDESGYLRQDTQELAERLECAPERIDSLRVRLRGYDPAGIFARDLPDCLALQLEERGQLDDPMRKLLENLDLLAAHDHAALGRKCGVNSTYLADMIAEIRTLDPRPATHFDHFVVQTIVPDILMKPLPKMLGGGWRVELNMATLPRVLINQDYYVDISARAHGKAEKTYLDQSLSAANWLIRAMDQRAQTILKVAGAVVERQNPFFLFGLDFLQPMTLADIAAEIGMHESTVSRVTTGKYIGTPRGLFEMKYFFSNGLSGSDGRMHTPESIRAKIRVMIDSEDPAHILSDDEIAETLQKQGLDIARRTVAKYRDSLKLASSIQRRKQKKHLAGNQ